MLAVNATETFAEHLPVSGSVARIPIARFWLQDYLCPQGARAYAALPLDLEAARATGKHVLLFSVPGLLVLSGFVYAPACQHWHNVTADTWHHTVRTALGLGV